MRSGPRPPCSRVFGVGAMPNAPRRAEAPAPRACRIRGSPLCKMLTAALRSALAVGPQAVHLKVARVLRFALPACPHTAQVCDVQAGSTFTTRPALYSRLHSSRPQPEANFSRLSPDLALTFVSGCSTVPRAFCVMAWTFGASTTTACAVSASLRLCRWAAFARRRFFLQCSLRNGPHAPRPVGQRLPGLPGAFPDLGRLAPLALAVGVQVVRLFLHLRMPVHALLQQPHGLGRAPLVRMVGPRPSRTDPNRGMCSRWPSILTLPGKVKPSALCPCRLWHRGKCCSVPSDWRRGVRLAELLARVHGPFGRGQERLAVVSPAADHRKPLVHGLPGPTRIHHSRSSPCREVGPPPAAPEPAAHAVAPVVVRQEQIPDEAVGPRRLSNRNRYRSLRTAVGT